MALIKPVHKKLVRSQPPFWVPPLFLLFLVLSAGCTSSSGGDDGPVFLAISGTVTGDVQGGVAVTLGGADSGLDFTDGGGIFGFSGLSAGSYTLTPSKDGYTFSPTSLNIALSGGDSAGNNFTSTAVTLTGTVSGDVADGVTLFLSGPIFGSVPTSGGGVYLFSGVPDGSYTLTPSLSGYVFSPASRNVTVSGGVSQGNLDFTATAVYTISGTLTGDVVTNVTMTLGGAASANTTTDAGGNYSFPGLFAGSYTVTPSKPGYTFSPGSQAPVITNADISGIDFNSTAVEISGTVSGDVFLGVQMTLGGAANGTAYTNGIGDYSFSPLLDGAYTVTPALAGYSFSPASTPVSISGGVSSAGNNFTSAAVTLSGTVSGDIADGVLITLTGNGAISASVNPVSTSGGGNYSFGPIIDGSTTITPSLAGYSFSPASRTVGVSGASQGSLDFTATKVSLSGTVSGDIADGVTMTLSGDGSDVQLTSGGGLYSFDPLPDGSYTLTPSRTGFTFSPTSRTVNVSGASQGGLDFTATSIFEISGTVSGDISADVTMTLGGDASDTVMTDGSGNYIFLGLVAGSYTVTPSRYGYTFSPVAQSPVVAADVSGVDFTSTVLPTYSISGTVEGLAGSGLVLQNNGGDDKPIAADGAFSFTTPVPDGYAYEVTVLAPPSSPDQTCVILNASGTISAAAVTDVTVKCGNARYAFVANFSDDSVSSYVVEGATGRLKYLGTVAAGTNPASVTVDPTGQHAYAANSGSGNVSQYTIGAGGRLTPKAIPTVPAGPAPWSVTVDPTGSYAYVANSGLNTVSQYTIGPGGGLIPMVPAAVTAGEAPFSVTVDPTGQYAYVANSGLNTVSQYTIGPAGGLIPMVPATVSTGTGPWAVSVDPTGDYVYVMNYDDGTLSQFSVGPGGELSPLAPATVSGLSSPVSGTADPSGRYFYAVNFMLGVSQFTIGSDGTLTPMATPIVGAGFGAIAVEVDPTGRYAYVSGITGNQITQYAIGPTGGLDFNSPIYAPARPGPYEIAVSRGDAAPGFVPKYAYAANEGSDDVSQYDIGMDGSLTAMAAGATVGAGTTPKFIAVDPSGQYAYAANSGDDTVSQYIVEPDGSLTANPAGAAVAAGTTPVYVTVDHVGLYAYVVNQGSANVSQYAIQSDGTLMPLGNPTVAAGTGPVSMALHPLGLYAYVVNEGGNDVSGYSIDTATGELTADIIGQPYLADTGPLSLAMQPSGGAAYAANSGSDNITQYYIYTNGRLWPLVNPDEIAAGTGPVAVAVDPTGQYVYAANSGSDNVSQYTADGLGILSPMAPATVAAGGGPASITVEGSGNYVYVSNSTDGTISQFWVIGGGLSPMAAPTAPAGTNPVSIITIGEYQ